MARISTFATLMAIATVAAPLEAQDAPRAPTRVTIAEIKRMLADLDLEATPGKSDDGKVEWVDVVRLPNRLIGRLHIHEDGTTLSIGISFPTLADKVSFETINAWNAAALHTRGLLDTRKKDGTSTRVPRIESDLDCNHGLTSRAFTRYVNRFESQALKFVDALTKDAGKPPLPSAPPAAKDPTPTARTDAPSRPSEPRSPASISKEVRLSETTWTGSEDLANFGDLRFDFKADGTAIMIDARQNPVRGNWLRNGTEVTIDFSNARYLGTLQGDTISGKGELLKQGTTWRFVVRLGTRGIESSPPRKDPPRPTDPTPTPTATPIPTRRPAPGSYQVAEVNFPFGTTAAQAQTAWRVHYRTDPHHGLRIVGAWLKRPGETPEWLKVVEDLHISQFYVPYADNSNRFFDMDRNIFPQHAPWRLDQVFPARDQLLGPNGQLLDAFTVREDRDEGLLWLFSDGKFEMMKQTQGPRAGKTFVNRRQAMMLWGVYQASNYFYVMQYTFHNDGVIQCRIGSTGKNLPGHRKESGHMHNGLWRVQLALGADGFDAAGPAGPAGLQELFVLKHEEKRDGQGKGAFKLYPVRQEGPIDWVPEEFTAIRFRNPGLKNTVGGGVTYDMVPLRYGSARHFAPARKQYGRDLPSDEFSQHDFWITNDDARYGDFRLLPQYTKEGAPLQGPAVIWHPSSNLHLPRDEDFVGEGKARTEGCATVMFSGFELRPKSVFSGTPHLKSSLFVTP